MNDIPASFSNISKKKIMQIVTATNPSRVYFIVYQYFTPSIKDYERTQRNEENNSDFNITGPGQIRPTDFIK